MDRDDAYRQLRERGVWVTVLAPVRAPGATRPTGSTAGTHIPWRFVPIMARTMFWRQFAQSQRSGLSLHDALGLLGDGRSHLGRFARDAAATMATGATFSSAMTARPDLFSPLEIAMLRAGESVGRLDTQADRLGQHFERQMEVRNQLRWRVAYLGMTLLAAAATGFVVTVVAPIVGALAGGPKANAAALIWSYCKPYLVLALVVGAVLTHYRTSPNARRKVDQLKMKLPVIGPLFRKIAIARYTRALGDLLGAGLPPGEAAEVATPTIGNQHLEARLASLPQRLRDGGQLSDALIDCCEMPPGVVQMVRTGEVSGSVDQMLAKVADYYEQEAVAATQTLVYVGFGLCVLLMSGFIGAYIIKFYTGLFGGLMDA